MPTFKIPDYSDYKKVIENLKEIKEIFKRNNLEEINKPINEIIIEIRMYVNFDFKRWLEKIDLKEDPVFNI